jgi:hypothetical protein
MSKNKIPESVLQKLKMFSGGYSDTYQRQKLEHLKERKSALINDLNSVEEEIVKLETENKEMEEFIQWVRLTIKSYE